MPRNQGFDRVIDVLIDDSHRNKCIIKLSDNDEMHDKNKRIQIYIITALKQTTLVYGWVKSGKGLMSTHF